MSIFKRKWISVNKHYRRKIIHGTWAKRKRTNI